MKYILKTFFIVILFTLFSSLGYSQVSYECTIDQGLNSGNLEISVFIKSTGATSFKIGGANFRMNVNTAGLDITNPPTELQEGLWDNDNDPINYGDQATGRNASQGWVSIDIFGEGTLDGVIVPSTETLVGKISIPITNPSLNSEVAWRVSGLNTLEVIDTDLNDITSNGTFFNPGTPFPLPVELVSFTASAKSNEIVLEWITETEVDNYGFEIQRSTKEDGNNSEWGKVGFMEGRGNSNSPVNYKFIDSNPFGGTRFSYRLKQIDTDGKSDYSDEIEIEILPTKFELFQNYPNPFNPMTNIKFSLPEDQRVSIRIYDIVGALVDELINKDFKAGFHKIEFNANKYSSGVYLYSMVTDKFRSVKKMLLIK